MDLLCYDCCHINTLKVSYALENPLLLSLEIPMEAAVNVVEVEAQEQKRQKTNTEQDADKCLPLVPFRACLDKFAAEDQINDYYSAYLGKTSVVRRGFSNKFLFLFVYSISSGSFLKTFLSGGLHLNPKRRRRKQYA